MLLSDVDQNIFSRLLTTVLLAATRKLSVPLLEAHPIDQMSQFFIRQRVRTTSTCLLPADNRFLCIIMRWMVFTTLCLADSTIVGLQSHRRSLSCASRRLTNAPSHAFDAVMLENIADYAGPEAHASCTGTMITSCTTSPLTCLGAGSVHFSPSLLTLMRHSSSVICCSIAPIK